MGYIKYRDKKYKTVTINLSKNSDFSSLLKEFHDIYFTDLDHKIEHIRYAILELVNNSIRAHKELERTAPISVRFTFREDYLSIEIKDAGGGFDTSNLPYDINRDVSEIDLNAPSFQNYREKHSYNRFGMGLLITKRTFDFFNITFYSEETEGPLWEQGKTIGTIIQMRSRI